MSHLDRLIESAYAYAAVALTDCDECGRPKGRRCHRGGRTVAPHRDRLHAAHALAADTSPCPAVSPESGVACVLPDVAALHQIGHIAPHPSSHPGSTVGWPTTPDEHHRWENPQ